VFYILKRVLNLRESHKLWKSRIKSWRILSVFGGIPLSTSENAAKMVIPVLWHLGNLLILDNDLDMVLFSPEKCKENLLVEKSFYFVFVCMPIHRALPLSPSENRHTPVILGNADFFDSVYKS